MADQSLPLNRFYVVPGLQCVLFMDHPNDQTEVINNTALGSKSLLR